MKTTDFIQQSYPRKATGFFSRQMQQLQKGGWPTISQKVVTLLCFPAVLTIRLLRPWIVIRLSQLDGTRIGHFAANTEIYLCERDLGISVPPQTFLDIWYFKGTVCNIQLEKMWRRTLRIWPTAIIHPVDCLSRRLPSRDDHIIPWANNSARDTHNVLERVTPHLSFLPEEEVKGKEGLDALHIPRGAPFICFHARDAKYLEVISDNSMAHHDYRDSDIRNFISAAEELAKQGYYLIRMGAVVKEELNVDNPKIIDYANSKYQNDFMDIYLGANCTFFLSTGSGIDAIPQIFRRPYVYVNFVPLEHAHSWAENHLFIPKKHWLRSEGRFMTFQEIFRSGAGRFLHSESFETAGIELVENSPEEIAALALEMNARLNGSWHETKEDDELQRRFWALFPASKLHGAMKARIGMEFLRQNREFLD